MRARPSVLSAIEVEAWDFNFLHFLCVLVHSDSVLRHRGPDAYLRRNHGECTMAINRCTKELFERLKQELDGKLECSAEVKKELEVLVSELQEAHLHEVSAAKQQALFKKCLLVLGLILRLSIPEIRHFFGD